MRFLIIGDVMGRVGRKCLQDYLPHARKQYSPDAVIINGENSAGGFGITESVYQEFVDLGVDAITSGNHWSDKKEILGFLPQATRLVLPGNMANVEGLHPGFRVLKSKSSKTFAVINLIGRVFMVNGSKCPFQFVDHILEQLRDIKVILLDIHAEASSEKYAIAHYLKGKVSMIWGTHTHVPTADAHILVEKTGFVSDIGMTGPFDSIIGIKTEASLARFLGDKSKEKTFETAKKDPWFCAMIVDIDEASGSCTYLERIIWRQEPLPL
ncbi:MAG: YmdB family metallophosphoesterase [Oligoflexales bacterium]|nr:YmdB family metallophosphoesterase [Oligoflexales bacterium]